MPVFYLNLYDRTLVVPDLEGTELPDLGAARNLAVYNIRSMLAEDVLHGLIDLGGRLDIVDERGEVLESVAFGDAIELRVEGRQT